MCDFIFVSICVTGFLVYGLDWIPVLLVSGFVCVCGCCLLFSSMMSSQFSGCG